MAAFRLCLMALLICIGIVAAPSSAQVMLPPAQQIGFDPALGPICAGPLGPGPCALVQQFIAIQNIANTVPVQVIGPSPQGPICAGPLGPGPCRAVQVYIATQQFAGQQFQLPVISNVPGVGAICAGPFGPAPCDALRMSLIQTQLGTGPMQTFDPRQPQLVGMGGKGVGPLCSGPFGPTPCNLIGQMALEASGAPPSQNSFNLPSGLNTAQQLAQACARMVGMDVTAFSGCSGLQIILPARDQAVLDCAVSSQDTATFARCAAPELGMRLSDDQRILAGCAMKSNGDASGFANCAGPAFADKGLSSDQKAILACAAQAGGEPTKFTGCASDRFLNEQQRAVVNCAVTSDTAVSFVECAAPNVGVKLSDDQRVALRCAAQSDGDASAFGSCAASALAGRALGPREQAVLGCAQSASDSAAEFAACAAPKLLGDVHLSKDQQIAITCAAQSQGDPTGMAVCAGANMFGMQLNPEQQIAVQCVVSTGGQPYAAAGCIASRLTIRELTKCVTDGIGGDGCFGDSNDLVGKNGWVRRSLGQIAGGPNSLFNNPGQIWGGDNSFVRNPGQILGGQNSFVRNPGQIWGGPNSVFNNPQQLAPKPLTLGKVGGHRICVPWC